MERLPYIDEHAVTVDAEPDSVWRALLETSRRELTGNPPAALIRLMDLHPSGRRGDWQGIVRVGDALPGFAVEEVREAEHLRLRGGHRFSSYSLVFDIAPAPGGRGSRLSARTYAAFPGLLGRGYKALVIDSRAHRLIVRRLLGRIASRA